MLASIAALTPERVIGLAGTLPWRLPGDLRHFRSRTLGGVVLMGRTTFDSIGRPLAHRENWVLTRQHDWSVPGVTVFHDVEELLEQALSRERVWVIGGAQIYRLLLPHCQQQELTWVEADVAGDAYYPEFDCAEWVLVDEQPGPPDEAYRYRFCTYQRR